MGDKTGIAWCDATWNPTRGCSLVSAGCTNCYAMWEAHRMSARGAAYEGLTRMTSRGPVWTGAVRVAEAMLDRPLRWQRPRRIFVNSMSDLFHEGLAAADIDRVFAVMALAPRHTFQVLTKRPVGMLKYLTAPGVAARIAEQAQDIACERKMKPPANVKVYPVGPENEFGDRWFIWPWPLPNVWLGVSVENQEAAEDRVAILLRVPAAIHFLSIEPLLGPVNLTPWLRRALPTEGTARHAINWAIIGGESGRHARANNVRWMVDLVGQLRAAGVATFVKQLGAEPGFVLEDEEARGNAMPSFHHYDAATGLYIKKLGDPKGGDPAEWPPELRIQEFPAAA